jgi:hypothetical protein
MQVIILPNAFQQKQLSIKQIQGSIPADEHTIKRLSNNEALQ